MTKKKLTPEEVVKYFKDEFKTKVKGAKIVKRKFASKKNVSNYIWMKIDRSVFKDSIKHLLKLQYPHLAVSSGSDIGKSIEIVFHFTLNYDQPLEEIILNITVELPKTDPTIDTISDIIPAAIITEREKMEMLGIKVNGIPDSSRVFIPDEFPEGVYPWRRDKTGPEKYYKNLHEVKK